MAVYESKRPTKSGGKYYFRIKYKDIYGKTVDYSSGKFKLKRDAIDAEIKYRVKLGEERISTSNITLKEAFLSYIEDKSRRVKYQTISKEHDNYVYLKPLEEYKINQITIPIYKKWRLDFDNNKLAPISKNKVLQLFKRIIKYSNKYYSTSLELLKFIDNFVDKNFTKKEMNFFTLDEYNNFDSVIDRHDYHTLFEILYYCGIRQGELQALTWKDINFDKKEMDINKTLTTKIKGKHGENYLISTPKTKNSTRILPMPKRVLEDLKIHKNNMMKYHNFKENWFVFGNTLPYGETRISKAKDKYCELSGKIIRIHDFRHSCASLLINQGASIVLVSKYLGHSNITITLDTYTHMYKNELTDIRDKIDTL